MLTLAIRKILSTLATLLLVSVAVYLVMGLVPGSRSQILMGDAVAQSSYEALDEGEGYLDWLSSVLHLDFGQSLFGGQSVSSLIAERIPVSLVLSITSLLLAIGFSIGLVALKHLCDRRAVGLAYNSLSLLSLSLPSFVVALVLILLFSVCLGILPSGGWAWGRPECLVLPSISLAFIHSGLFMRFLDSAVSRELKRGYALSAASRGLGKARILFAQVAPNLAGEFSTLCLQSLVSLMTSSAAVEYIFSIPGLGSLTVSAIARRDVNTIVAIVMLATALGAVLSVSCDLVSGFYRKRGAE